ncbi:E3 ubiquitin-protein ligase XIAP isoform X1 [Hemibagrus wyckioides]|nr:E3 ubiquitin-protein ligase XIAP isoform X1 [Hemibagrus wyckioides]
MAGSSMLGEIETDDCLEDWSAMSTRLSSFQSFPNSVQVPAERLARAGLYFTGESDRVRCFSCLHTIENWHQGDNPVERHQSVSPSCIFLKCVHHRSPTGGTSSQSHGSIYDEDDEAMEYRLRTGEVVDESMYPKVPHMKSEDVRLRTFINWPSWSPVQPHDLAQAGMFYVPESNRQLDRVQCFCCAGMLVNWEEGDDPWQEHARLYPNCFFILGHDVGNIPSEQPRQSRSSSMESFEERFESFKDRAHPINPEMLARAGFYSMGERDGVVCFKCGGRLKTWQPDDDPWVEHAKFYPGCSFLLAEKGQEFINSVQLRHPAFSTANGFSSHERPASNVLQLEIARKAVEMGYDPDKVQRFILEKLRRSSKGYSAVEDLIRDIYSGVGDVSAMSLESKTEDPLKKLEKLQHEKLCKVCMDSDVTMVFIPCGHLVTCMQCSESLQKCPICCAEITQKIKTFSS